MRLHRAERRSDSRLRVGREVRHSAVNPMRACPVCQAGAASALWKKAELQLVRCPECGMVFADPVPPEFASGEFYDRHESDYYLSPDKLESDYAPVRFERELRIFRRHCLRGKVLDVGCSTGGFLFRLKRCFPGDYEVLGTDVTTRALDFAESKGVPVVRGPFLAQPFSASFAAVTFWAVIEHLAEPRAFLEKASSLLEPGGHCFVLVPNFKSLAIRLLGARYRYVMPDHVNYFTATTLERLARSTGFEVVEMGTCHFNPIVLVQDFRGSQGRVADADRGRLLRRTTAMKQNPLLGPLKVGYRGVEALLARFGLADNLCLVARRRS